MSVLYCRVVFRFRVTPPNLVLAYCPVGKRFKQQIRDVGRARRAMINTTKRCEGCEGHLHLLSLIFQWNYRFQKVNNHPPQRSDTFRFHSTLNRNGTILSEVTGWMSVAHDWCPLPCRRSYDTGHGFTLQMSAAYWAIVRSLENFPEAATFRIALRAQPSGSRYNSLSRLSASR